MWCEVFTYRSKELVTFLLNLNAREDYLVQEFSPLLEKFVDCSDGDEGVTYWHMYRFKRNPEILVGVKG